MQVCYEFADPKQGHMREKTGRTVYLNSIREKASINFFSETQELLSNTETSIISLEHMPKSAKVDYL